ncbi:MAG: hypothetical protein NTU49_08265, partial [Gammaproteobacteria bacterium]|nr:hypothetical protein [Gammaproteobacteria bacterium]
EGIMNSNDKSNKSIIFGKPAESVKFDLILTAAKTKLDTFNTPETTQKAVLNNLVDACKMKISQSESPVIKKILGGVVNEIKALTQPKSSTDANEMTTQAEEILYNALPSIPQNPTKESAAINQLFKDANLEMRIIGDKDKDFVHVKIAP